MKPEFNLSDGIHPNEKGTIIMSRTLEETIIKTYNKKISFSGKKPYHHLPDGTFRNPEGSPKPNPNVKWSFKIFNREKKKT